MQALTTASQESVSSISSISSFTSQYQSSSKAMTETTTTDHSMPPSTEPHPERPSSTEPVSEGPRSKSSRDVWLPAVLTAVPLIVVPAVVLTILVAKGYVTFTCRPGTTNSQLSLKSMSTFSKK